MQLTDKEMALVSRAEGTLRRAKISRIILLVAMLTGFAAMLVGAVKPDIFAYCSFAVVLYAILLPQFGGPPDSEVVALLTRIRSETDVQKVDPLIDVLTRNT
ncbi:hypothetical protein N8Z40_01980 [Pseudomonadales bacterium]|nr:hypothetical protein [Pseudomonadales bacterium]